MAALTDIHLHRTPSPRLRRRHYRGLRAHLDAALEVLMDATPADFPGESLVRTIGLGGTSSSG
jgi:hypothetical protein